MRVELVCLPYLYLDAQRKETQRIMAFVTLRLQMEHSEKVPADLGFPKSSMSNGKVDGGNLF